MSKKNTNREPVLLFSQDADYSIRIDKSYNFVFISTGFQKKFKTGNSETPVVFDPYPFPLSIISDNQTIFKYDWEVYKPPYIENTSQEFKKIL